MKQNIVATLGAAIIFTSCQKTIDSPITKKNAEQVLNNKSSIDISSWKGVNLPVLSKSSNQKNLSQTDFDYAASAGANVIRLSVHADPFDKRFLSFTNKDRAGIEINSNEGISALKEAVAMAKKDNLKVIIDMHSMPGRTNGEIWLNQFYWDELSNIWTAITSVFKDDNTVIAFDLMNEPNVYTTVGSADIGRMFKGTWTPPARWTNTPRDYNLQIGKLISAIRKIDNNRYVIVEGFGYLGNPVNYNWMKPIEGFDKVIYSFHMYEPTGLTMIGTKNFLYDNKVGVPFILSRDMEKIDNALKPVIAFQKKYNVPVYVGEFGVTDDAIFKSDANGVPYNGAAWLTTVINKMIENKWGWTYWDFWTDIRKPDSNTDPRYVILRAAMTGQLIPIYK